MATRGHGGGGGRGGQGGGGSLGGIGIDILILIYRWSLGRLGIDIYHKERITQSASISIYL